MPEKYYFLDKINYPEDLKELSKHDLVQVSAELRNFIIDIVSSNPGHFGASLGVVELTVALHYVFNTPYDKLVWDVGHQAYGHKILTGRKDVFYTNRKYKGISGFPNIFESKYDSFGVGHSSTSISAALGMAISAKQNNEDRKVVAIIGDGSMTAGLAFEGLNNAGSSNSDILVILNDNNISIDPSVGAIKEYLLDISTSRTYNKVKDDVWRILGKINKLGPNTQRIAQKIDNSLKSLILHHSNLFEAFNFRYFGPIDGHDVVKLTEVLSDLKKIKGPKLLHVITKKGKGFKQAEINQTVFHAPGKFNKETGELINKKPQNPEPVKFQEVFGRTIVELAKENKKIYGITPAMPSGSSLNYMMNEIPERAFDVGIAEQHAVTFSAGLAVQGNIPFCNIYSTFMQRAFDQVIHDVALQKLNVVFCLDRGGLVGDDGATHHGSFDLAYMRLIPNIIVSAPMDEIELRNLMYTAQLKPRGPFAIRYPRGKGTIIDWKKPFKEIQIGKARKISSGDELVILTIGKTGVITSEAIKLANKKNISVEHYDMRFVKPIDKNVLDYVAKNFKNIITIEDGTIIGGFGSAVTDYFSKKLYKNNIYKLGVPDNFIEHGTQEELYKECGFDVESVYKLILKISQSILVKKEKI